MVACRPWERRRIFSENDDAHQGVAGPAAKALAELRQIALKLLAGGGRDVAALAPPHGLLPHLLALEEALHVLAVHLHNHVGLPEPPQLRQQRLPKASLLRKTTRKNLLRSNPRDLEDSDFEVNDEVTFGRNRQSERFGKVVEDDELSDHVKFRLWLARQIALAKYREVHG